MVAVILYYKVSDSIILLQPFLGCHLSFSYWPMFGRLHPFSQLGCFGLDLYYKRKSKTFLHVIKCLDLFELIIFLLFNNPIT